MHERVGMHDFDRRSQSCRVMAPHSGDGPGVVGTTRLPVGVTVCVAAGGVICRKQQDPPNPLSTHQGVPDRIVDRRRQVTQFPRDHGAERVVDRATLIRPGVGPDVIDRCH